MLFYCYLTSHFVSLCVCLSMFVLCICTLVLVCQTSPVNGFYYQTIKSPMRTLFKSAPPKKTFTYAAWPWRACCMSCLSTPPSPLCSCRSRGNTTPDVPFGEPKMKRLSVLQAVALGYCPILQENREEEMCTGNQDTLADV